MQAIHAPHNSGEIAKLFKSRLMNSKTPYPKIIYLDGIAYENNEAICELFSKHFARLYTLENDEVVDFPRKTDECLSDIIFTTHEIDKAVANLKLSNTTGPDGISSVLLKKGGNDMSLLLLKLYSISLSDGTYPNCWKKSYIVPIHKYGPIADINNYRPINITSVVSRVMEKIVKTQIIQYLLSNDLLSPSQYGFLSRRSCITCHLDYFDYITQSIDNGRSVTTLFLDVSKAFDKVPHIRLLTKLQSYGITGNLHKWISSFLTERQQLVKINHQLSSSKPITSGVIQGSVLGPILFLLFINDIVSVIKYGKPYLFADDLKIVYDYGYGDMSVESKIQQDLNDLGDWSEKWQLTFNPDKCGITHLGRWKPIMCLYMYGKLLSKLNTVTDLGITYSDLSFSDHANKVVSDCKRLTGFVLRNFYTQEARLAIYRTCIRPKLEYCALLFSNLRTVDRKKIESVQRFLTKRIIGFDQQVEYVDRCVRLKLEPLWLRRVKCNLFLLFKVIRKHCYSNSSITWENIKSYQLRNHDYLVKVATHRKSIRANFFTIKYCTLWNQLPPEIRCCENPDGFKRSLERHFNMSTLARLKDHNCW
uniref:Reverse transcriptase domain-containing protein n=1 Tax=Trichobilharzia regenti TaxID=157069 RepID=A0AA85ITX5_TRIRE|nr:unnamed protein product [Trichobilharzia regenti]